MIKTARRSTINRNFLCSIVTATFASVAIGHSEIVKKHYLNVKMVLQKLRYSEHNWVICVDCKMVNFVRTAWGYTTHLCFFCYWDSRATDQH